MLYDACMILVQMQQVMMEMDSVNNKVSPILLLLLLFILPLCCYCSHYFSFYNYCSTPALCGGDIEEQSICGFKFQAAAPARSEEDRGAPSCPHSPPLHHHHPISSLHHHRRHHRHHHRNHHLYCHKRQH